MQSKPIKLFSTLILDSSLAILNFASAVLKQDFGIGHIRKVSSPVTALEILRTESEIDLLLLDLSMPEMDGMAFIEQLASLNYQGYVIVMSGVAPQILSSVEQAFRNFDLSYLGTVLKPLDGQKLSTLLMPIVSVSSETKQSKFEGDELKVYQLVRAFNSGDLTLYYQPRIDVQEKSFNSVEVLLKLDKTIGLVSPAKLLSRIEQNDVLVNVAAILLRQVFRDWSNWKKTGLELKLSIDIGCLCFQKAEFVAELESKLNHFGISKQQVSFVVDQKELTKDNSEFLVSLSQLTNQGFKFSLGELTNSVISKIQNLAIEEIILSTRSLAVNKTIGEELPLAESYIALAKHLGIVTLCKGVDTKKDFKLCEQLGCDAAQGLYVSEPILANEVVARMARWKYKTD